MTTSEDIKRKIEAAAEVLGVAPSTVGERAGQGGMFYARLCDGRRVWPETAASVERRIDEMLARGRADIKGARHTVKHGNANAPVQPEGER